jgi:hypothetical protein
MAALALRLTAPGCRTRSDGRTFAQANGMTAQGLGEGSAATEAGNLVLCAVGIPFTHSGLTANGNETLSIGAIFLPIQIAI